MSARECNLCQYVNMAYEHRHEGVELRPRPSAQFPKGVDVYVGGEFKVWFAEIPAECEC
jgi:hypothetical protein